MAYYLVDYENVHIDGLNGINNLDKKDKISIFYSDNANTLTFDLHRELAKTDADIEYIKVETGGKNALDFQLVSYLGFLIAADKTNTFYVVTKDCGFNSAVQFWTNRKINVEAVVDLNKKCSKDEQALLFNAVAKVASSEEADIVIAFIQKYKTKQGINNALVKKYESKKAGEIYKVIKPFIADKIGR